MRKRKEQGVVYQGSENAGGVTEPLPASPLFPPRPDYGPQPEHGSLKRIVLVVVLAVVLTLLLAGGGAAAFLLYHGQSNKISDLRGERDLLQTRNGELESQLTSSRQTVKATSAKLAQTSKKLRKAKADAVAAKKQASSQYGVGFSAGTSTGYSAGASDSYNSGYNSGWDVGYNSAYAYCESVVIC